MHSSWGMLSWYTAWGFWGVFPELHLVCCLGGMGSAENGEELEQPGLAAVTANCCLSTQEQFWIVQWRWDLSHASKLHSRSKYVEGFSTVRKQVLWKNSWHFLVPRRLKNTVRMWWFWYVHLWAWIKGTAGRKEVENERKNKLTELLPLSDSSWVLGKAWYWYFIPASPC